MPITIDKTEFSVKVQGPIDQLLLILDFVKPENYALYKNQSDFILYLEKIPSYKNIYENILRFESIWT